MPTDRPAHTGSRPKARRPALLGLGVVGAAMAALVGASAMRVHRLRQSAEAHAHDLDHRATVGEGLGEPVRLLVLGDSAARGYGLGDPADAFPQQCARRLAARIGRRVEVTCLATDGHRTADVVAEQLPLLPAARPDAVIVSVGVNDAVRGTPTAAVRAATGSMLARMRASGAVTVLVTCPDLGRAPALPFPLRRALGRRCRRVAATQQAVAHSHGVRPVPLVDVDRRLYGADGFHPGAAAHAMMADAAVDGLVAEAADLLTAS